MMLLQRAGYTYCGVEFARGLCGVSVIRSGEAMEAALRECCQGIKIGKVLVHRWVQSLHTVQRDAGCCRFVRENFAECCA